MKQDQKLKNEGKNSKHIVVPDLRKSAVAEIVARRKSTFTLFSNENERLVMPEKLIDVLNSGSYIEHGKYKEKFNSNGRSSEYVPFLDEAECLERGQVIYYDEPVTDSFVSGVRNQVYKLNDDDAEPSDREYTVEATKEKDRSGNDVTDEKGRKLYTFCIRRKDK